MMTNGNDNTPFLQIKTSKDIYRNKLRPETLMSALPFCNPL